MKNKVKKYFFKITYWYVFLQLQQHVDRLANVAANLRRKNELLSAMAKNFIQEKSELQSKLSAIGKETAPDHHGIESTDVVDVGRQRSSEGGVSGNKSLAANVRNVNSPMS